MSKASEAAQRGADAISNRIGDHDHLRHHDFVLIIDAAADRKYKPLVEAAELALGMFDKDHAIDRFDWGRSALSGENIAELNEIPLVLRSALNRVKGE